MVYRCLACAIALLGCNRDQTSPDDTGSPEALPPCDNADPLRQPFFGDTHVHTTLSLDANLQGTRLRPDDAYDFAKGETVSIQPYDADGNGLRSLTIDRRLDWAVVSDHAEFLGTVKLCEQEGSSAYDDPNCVGLRDNPAGAFVTLNSALAAVPGEASYPDLCGDDAADCITAGTEVWEEIQLAAEAAYERADCTFTTFNGYEWTANPEALNLHRNVIFANDDVPDYPIGYFDATSVEDLWSLLQTDCIDAEGDCDVLTIPHNSNLSSGLMFSTLDEEPLDAEEAELRARMEPLVEIFQHKGDSECWPGSPVADELCGFEKLPYNSLAGTNLGVEGTPLAQDFVRDALAEGLRYQAEVGANPYQYGFVASTDTHIAAPGSVSEDGYPGHGGAGQSNRDALPAGLPDGAPFNPGGLAVLWAEENRREALFAAMKRREAYGTSGPRIILRFFGGWDYPSDLCAASNEDFVLTGDARGVPMGGELPAGSGAPTFAVKAAADAGTPDIGLQRLQIVKGWLDQGEVRVEVFDVAGDPDNGATVDPLTCEPQGSGFDELCQVWTDPDFDASAPAFYYARAIENPTCRWHTRQCLAAGITCPTDDEDWEGCCDERLETTVQERAWSSPVFHTPQ